MRLPLLRVVHLKKSAQLELDAHTRVQNLLPEGVFCLDSCQRWVWILSEDELPAASRLAFEVPAAVVYEGADAYQFLLRVATGLESHIAGETDIFGQLKEAWRKGEGSSQLNVLMQKVFEDTKEIRSLYLQNTGGASYGSLVRMFLRNQPGPTLVVGAGQIAQSVAPYLLDQELWISNRSAEPLALLYTELVARQAKQGGAKAPLRVISKADEERAWKEAVNVVVCIPFDEMSDRERVALRLACQAGGTVIHLGGTRDKAGPWNRLAVFYSLDDLFALQKSQGDARLSQIQQAARACEEKAKLRSLGASISIPHGWEDLAVFA